MASRKPSDIFRSKGMTANRTDDEGKQHQRKADEYEVAQMECCDHHPGDGLLKVLWLRGQNTFCPRHYFTGVKNSTKGKPARERICLSCVVL